VIIRRLQRADAEVFRALRLEALRDSPTAFGTSHHEEAAQPLEWFAAALDAAAGRQLFGAFVDGQLVGMVGVGREPAAKERHRAVIRSMFVSPQVRGRGIATALLSTALAVADAMPGVWQVTLTVTRGNDAAISLYSRHGFVPYGTLPASLQVDGTYYDDVLMIRQRPDPSAERAGPPAIG
jgi:ribosomal protein S18 acetylase RimI-like enzyme